MAPMEKFFMSFADPYIQYGDKIIMKVEHSLRVKELCLEIARSLDLTADEIKLSETCGLWHDVGRFEQWKRYETYNDFKSVDHGDLGAELLKNNNVIEFFSDDCRNIIISAVSYHNKFSIPRDLNDEEELFVKITRDADKIDILRSYAEGVLTDKPYETAMSESVYREVMECKSIDRQTLTVKADAIGIRLAFVFDLNYPRSFQLLKSCGYLDQLIDRYIEETRNKELRLQLENLRRHVGRHVAERAEGLSKGAEKETL